MESNSTDKSSKEASSAKIAIVGTNGYAGAELEKLAFKHPKFDVRYCFVRNSVQPHLETQAHLSPTSPRSVSNSKRGVPRYLPLSKLNDLADTFDTIFFATPPDVSFENIKQLVHNKNLPKQIIDLSGAFRLNSEKAFRHYGLPLSADFDLFSMAKYGIAPYAWTREDSSLETSLAKKAFNPPSPFQLISNPGCFATSVLMAIVPILQAGLIEPDSLVMDCKSGTMGAGKKAQERLLFSELANECLPYRVGSHQHIPEICDHAKHLTGIEIDPTFVTSILPVRRGIISGIYSKLKPEISNLPKDQKLSKIHEAFEVAVGEYPLIRHSPLSQEETHNKLLLLRNVVGTAFAHISYTVEDNKLFIFACIDNLLKGAASQAIENWNLSHGLPVDLGLEHLEVIL